ncbi:MULTISPECIES: hypothetical protein [unclassified Microbacterium]|uniref:hypothetical protein n=1 Tax=unclassified Microbacterium TaxID=2609290 RepID=UPI000C2C3E27|nr:MULTISPECIES: hypothetical protein [unclassified Microbacterium]
MTGTPVPGADGGPDGSIGDTTVRRPRIPSSPEAAALVEGDQANDTVVVRRVSRDRGAAGSRPLGESSSPGLQETSTGAVAAYPSRVAAPVRGSRRTQPPPTHRGGGDSRVPLPRVEHPLPDASGIRRAVRARARRRLVAVVVAIVALVVVLAGALIALVFAVGV